MYNIPITRYCGDVAFIMAIPVAAIPPDVRERRRAGLPVYIAGPWERLYTTGENKVEWEMNFPQTAEDCVTVEVSLLPLQRVPKGKALAVVTAGGETFLIGDRFTVPEYSVKCTDGRAQMTVKSYCMPLKIYI